MHTGIGLSVPTCYEVNTCMLAREQEQVQVTVSNLKEVGMLHNLTTISSFVLNG